MSSMTGKMKALSRVQLSPSGDDTTKKRTLPSPQSAKNETSGAPPRAFLATRTPSAVTPRTATKSIQWNG